MRRALPLALAHGLVVATVYVLKPARTALFLTHVGVEELPYVLMLAAGFGALSGGVHAAFARTLGTRRIAIGSFGALGVGLLAFRVALPLAGWPWLVYAFYVFVNLYGAIAVSLVWLIAGMSFDAREARRTFGIVGSGGIAGAMVGGLVASGAASAFGTDNLLLVCAAMLVPAVVLLARARPSGAAAASSSIAIETEPDAARSTRLLSVLASVTFVAAVVAAIVDVQFSSAVQSAFATTDAKTVFLGRFFAVLGAVGFLVQLLVTRRVLGSLGVGAALMVLPVALLLGGAGIFVWPGLLAATFARGADGALRHSIHKAATEVLVLPVPAARRARSKLLLDAAIDALATGVGALLVLVLTRRLGLSHAQLGLVSVPLCLVWLALVVTLRRKDAGVSFRWRPVRARREPAPTAGRPALSPDITSATASNH